ncbi:MAG: polymer-forming cytoskeletal protein, partial [Thermoplasmata archaeon]|nr:polymer-forming cytoskeletal protein [Thermoplasmata archaeon]NIY04976.1 hypothetical protein [Thermoplasmata archaeon]
SSVEGDLYYEVIQMEEGAGITGTCSHISATKPGKPVTPALSEGTAEALPDKGQGTSTGSRAEPKVAAQAKRETG